MSLIVAMKAKDAIIMGADSRATYNVGQGVNSFNDTAQKLFPMGSCGVGIAGSIDMTSALIAEFQNEGLDSSFKNIIDGKNCVVKNTRKWFNEWFASITLDKRPSVAITLAGYRLPAGQAPIPMIYHFNSHLNFAPQLVTLMPCLSGVPHVAMYLAQRYYDKNLPVKRAKTLTYTLIAETASQEPTVGGPIQIAVITSAQGYKQTEASEVEKIHKAYEELSKALKNYFYTGTNVVKKEEGDKK